MAEVVVEMVLEDFQLTEVLAVVVVLVLVLLVMGENPMVLMVVTRVEPFLLAHSKEPQEHTAIV